MRVANGHEPGAYFHMYFLRGQPQLVAQMFCKNARTMLAMSSSASIALPTEMKTNDVVPMKQIPSLVPVTESPSLCQSRPSSVSATRKEQLHQMLLDHALRLQQHLNVSMQQDNLLQMRRMVEMNIHRFRLQQQQQIVRQLQEGDSGTARFVRNNRASAA